MKIKQIEELQSNLEVRYENHGFDGEKSVIVPIMYDPKTGFTYDVGDFNDIEGEENAVSTEQNKT